MPVKHAVTHRNSKRNSLVLVLFLILLIVTGVLMEVINPPIIFIGIFLILIYAALRLPLALFARDVQKVEVEVLEEVEVGRWNEFKEVVLTDEWIVLRKNLGFPLVIPRTGSIENSIRKIAKSNIIG